MKIVNAQVRCVVDDCCLKIREDGSVSCRSGGSVGGISIERVGQESISCVWIVGSITRYPRWIWGTGAVVVALEKGRKSVG